jgi:hypothetical protein
MYDYKAKQTDRTKPGDIWLPAVVLVVTVTAMAVAVLSLGGCAQVRDAVADAIGAPTTAQIEQARAQREQAEQAIAQLKAQVHAADAAAQEADRQAEQRRQQAVIIRQGVAQAALQLGQADPGTPAFDALSRVLDQLRAQLTAVLEQADQYATIAARYGATAAQVQVHVDAAAASLRQAEARLAAYDQQTRERLEATGQAIAQMGEAASAFGVPGAAPIAATAGAALVGLLGTLFGVKKSRDEQRAVAASVNVVRSIEAAKQEPEFRDAFAKAAPLIEQLQSAEAKALVDRAQTGF